MPQGPLQLEQNARTLQQARGGRTPEEMAQILGVARDALGDAANNVYNWLMPQDATDVAAELVPASKGIGAAIGLIPPRLMRPMIERLKMMVRARFREVPNATDYQELINRQIDDYPGTAAHLSSVSPLSPAEALQDGERIAGLYDPIWRPTNATDMQQRQLLNTPEYYNKTIKEIAQQSIKPLKEKEDWWGGKIKIDPTLDRDAFLDVLRHEFDHGAQDVLKKLDPDADGWSNTIDYLARPHEIRARLSERRGRILRWAKEAGEKPPTFNYKSALKQELDELEGRYVLDPDKLPEFNSVLMALNEDLHKSGYRLKITSPKMSVGPASMKPRRQFDIERIVLDR